MADEAAVDTDVLLKAAAYRIAAAFVETVGRKGRPATLGLTHLIAGKQLSRKRNIRDGSAAASELTGLLGSLGRLEPDDEEVAMAADLAARAQERSLPLDAGEAQLVAITAMRGLPILVTGDKRALGALSALLDGEPEKSALAGRLACFEQVVATVATMVGARALRDRVCAEPEVDGAMRLACSCGRDDWDPEQLNRACESFVGAVRADAGDLLVAGSLFA